MLFFSGEGVSDGPYLVAVTCLALMRDPTKREGARQHSRLSFPTLGSLGGCSIAMMSGFCEAGTVVTLPGDL